MFPKRDPFAKLGRLLLGLPAWVLLPLMVVRQEGEVLRAWAQRNRRSQKVNQSLVEKTFKPEPSVDIRFVQ